MKIVTLIFLTFLIAIHFSFAQEGVNEEKEHEGKNRIGFVVEGTFVPEGYPLSTVKKVVTTAKEQLFLQLDWNIQEHSVIIGMWDSPQKLNLKVI